MTTPDVTAPDSASSPAPSADLRALLGVATADVWKGDRKAATLERTPAGIRFAYDSGYVGAKGPAVALTLPLSDVPVETAAGAVPAFFAGLLPEGRRLAALRAALKTSLDDDFSLLLAVGPDPVGDVRVVPGGRSPELTPALVHVSRRADLDFARVQADTGVLDRRGMAGVQEKVSAAMITLPARFKGHDALIKLNPPEAPHLVENEAWFLGLAREAGIRTPRFELIRDAQGVPGLLVERFDRIGTADALQRLPVEDATQVLNWYPADKYRMSTEQACLALIKHCQAQRVAARDLFRLFVFAYLTGNGDVHGKNVSIVQSHGEWVVAPAYDLPSTLPYGDMTMALPVAGRTHDLSHKAFMSLAESIDLPAPAAERVITNMLDATAPARELFEGQTAEFTRPRNAEAVAQLRNRRRLLQGG